LKITAHKTFKNKFDQIRAGRDEIYLPLEYFRDRLQCIVCIPVDKHATFDRQLERVLFFLAAMQAKVFSIEKTL